MRILWLVVPWALGLSIACGGVSNPSDAQKVRDLQATIAALQRSQARATPSAIATPAPTAIPTLTPIPASALLPPTPAGTGRLNEAVAVTLISKGFSKGDYTSTIDYRFGIENKTAKDMLGVKGTAVFSDLFGDEISRLGISYDKPIAAGKTAIWDAESSFNQFIAKDAKLRDTPQERIKFSFVPITVLFTDGSKLDTTTGQ